MPRRQHASGCSQRDRGQTDRQTDSCGSGSRNEGGASLQSSMAERHSEHRVQKTGQNPKRVLCMSLRGSGFWELCLLHIGKNDLRRTFQGDGTRTRKGKWIWFVPFPTWSKGSFLAFCQNSGLLKRCVQFAKPAHVDQGFAEAAPVHCRKCGG